jgi:hypothetical protein
MSFERVSSKIDGAMAAATAATVEMLDAVAEMDEGRWYEWDGHTSTSGWLMTRYYVAEGTAWEWVRLARALRELPLTREAYASGRLSYDQLRHLTRFARPATEGAWLPRACRMEPNRLWVEARRQERLRRAEVEEDHRARHLWMGWDEERRFLRIHGELPGAQGEAFQAAVQHRAKEIRLEAGPVYDPKGARQADAVLELVSGAGQKAAPATLVVHADAAVVTGASPDGTLRMAETASGIQLCEETVRRLSCDARIEWHVRREGRLLGIGVEGRKVPGWMMRAVEHRDRSCRFPGCGRTMYLHAHHVVHWARGGRTELSNLVLLCTAHHRALHEGGWGTSGRPDGRLRFHDPTGRAVVGPGAARASPSTRAA